MAIRKSNYLKLGIYALLILFTVAAGMYSVSTFTSAVTGVVTGLTVSPDPIRLGSSVYIQYSISQNALITIKVYKDTGELVRTVLNNVSKPAGTFNQGWDGKNASGALVSDGYYRFVIEARDAGGALTGQAEKTQIAARFPSITGVLDTPDPFDPKGGEQSNISFTLSSDSLITVTILKGYSPVRTITSNELKLAGNHTLVWDGKNDAGIIQADAVYTYQIQANSPLVPTFMTTLKSYSTIAQNPPQITDFMISPDPFKIAASTMSIRYNLSENANVTLKVVDAVSGSVIKTILNAAARTAGYNSNAWDGTNDSGVHVPEGSYKVVISAVDNSNMSSGEQNIAFTAGYQPVISDAAFSPNPFNPADPTNNIATVSYAISNNAIVKVDILNGYVPVRTLVNNQVQTAGNNSVIWDGRDDSGNIAGDGIYSFQITATSQAVPTFSSTVKGSLTVEKGPPSITEVLLSPDPFKLGTTAGLSVRYNLSESSTVSVSVYKGPAVVRNLVTGTAKNAGYNSEIWDGKDNTGNWVGEGVYTIAIRAADGSGGTGQASGSVTAGYLPEISGGGSAPEPFDPLAGNANVSFNLSREAKVTVTMLRGLMTVRTIQAGILAAGPHTIPWDGKDDNGLPVSDGPYTYQVDAVSPTVANFFSRFQGVITVESKAPELTDLSVSPYVVRIGSPATLRYTLSEPATITMQILDAASGSSVRTLPVETKNSGGYYTVSWNTNNDQNTLINSGDYIFRVVAVDNFNKTCRAEIQFQAGAVPVISGNLAMPGTIDVSTGGTATVSYSVSETSFVTVRVLDTTGAVIKTLTRYKEATGADSTVWDGTDAWGLAKNGTFTYTIDANSVIGNFRATQASGTITVMGASDSQPVNSCASCHQGYPAPSHLVSNCIGCHGDDKPIENCASCHPSQTHGPEVLSTFGCDYCHNTVYNYKIPVHPTDPPLHDSIFILNREVSCEQCHANNINTEHVGKVNSVTNTEMTCQTCHKSLDPLVLAAIVAQTTNCDSCHNSPVLQHNPVHTASVYTTDTTRSDAGTCNVCHTGKDLEALHVGRVNSATDQAMTCDTCHTSTDPLVVSAISTGLTDSCETCHTIHTPKDPTAVHDTTDVFAGTADTDCATCHDRNVKIEHIDNGRTASTGAGITCDTCHASASQQVTDAITANNTRCDACHTMPPAAHNPVHTATDFTTDLTRTDLATCTLCHVKTITDQHVNKTTTSGTNMDCRTCHSSTVPAAVQAAVDSVNDNCEACHTVHGVKPAVTEHGSADVYATNADVNCSGCHERNIRTEHMDNAQRTTSAGTAITCDTCHGSSNVDIVAAIATGNNKCDACHTCPVTEHNPAHVTAVYTTDTTRSDAGTCNVCHTGKDLEALHVGRVNSATDQAMTCDTCHTSTDPLVLSAISTGLTNSCETCHIIHAPKDATAVHDTTDVFAGTTDTDCGTCHDRNVKIEHIDNGRTTSTGAAITCDTCHASASQQVTDAITANNTRCDACHTIHADITTAHTAPGYGYPAYSWNCGQCHTKVLTDEHSNRGMTCSACHDSTKALVQAAITSTATDGSNLKCSTCHTGTADGAGAIHTTLDYPHLTGIFPTAEDDDCLNCHTAQNGEFSAFKASYHVTGDLMSKASGYGTYVSPWTATGYVGCQGCHGSGTVGGTTAYNNILKKPYTYTSNSGQADMLCFVCHNRNTYGAGSSGSGSTGFSREGKNLHNIGDHKVNSVSQCTWCHTSRPHASDRPHLIVTMNEANSQGNLLTSFYHQTSGNYRKSSCGSNASACDEHDEY